MRHTKIIATVGPASDTDRSIEELIAAGVDIFRLNFSHGTHASHGAVCRRIRAAAERTGRVVGILQDLSGPKIRTGRLQDGRPLALRGGDELRIATGDFAGGPGRVSTTYGDLARAVRPGDTLLLDDGRVELRVVTTDGAEIQATVVDGGTLGENKGINAPGVALPASSMTSKDAEDVRFGLGLGVDYVAVSFVRSAADLRAAREIMGAAGGAEVPLVAKLERPEALDRLEEILDACDAVMVARGDLGLELPLERVPQAQKKITRRARARGLPVIVATQVLESMRTEPRPTRAEVSDAANAVEDGVDAIMLAGETAIGAFPGRAVQTLDAIIRDAEAILSSDPATARFTGGAGGHERALSEAAVALAARGEAYAIVAVTRAGTTARLLSALRPAATIYAATDRAETARQLALLWGVAPLVMTLGASGVPGADKDAAPRASEIDVDTAGVAVAQELRARGAVPPGAVVVLVSVNPDLGRGDANFLKLQRLT